MLHAHNFWFNLRDGGPWWVLGNLATAPWRRGLEVGDKYFPYGGVPNFFPQVFRERELRADLRHARLAVRR